MVNVREREADRFTTFVLEHYKSHVGLNGWNTLQLFLAYGVIDYLKQYYEITSSEPLESVFADIDEFIAARQQQ